MSLMLPNNEEMRDLRQRVNRMFQESWRPAPETPRAWAPPVDIVETDHEFVLQAEVPGMTKDEIDIQLTGDTLTLRGDRKPVSGCGHFHRMERPAGLWQRVFQVEAPIAAAEVSAAYQDGVLTVRLPKKEQVRARQISINVGGEEAGDPDKAILSGGEKGVG